MSLHPLDAGVPWTVSTTPTAMTNVLRLCLMKFSSENQRHDIKLWIDTSKIREREKNQNRFHHNWRLTQV